eukprot:1143281-Pelagomonas_calceolata.AAC.8
MLTLTITTNRASGTNRFCLSLAHSRALWQREALAHSREALEKAKHDFEKSVDTALGIEEAERKQQEEQKQAGRTGTLSSNGAETGERRTATKEVGRCQCKYAVEEGLQPGILVDQAVVAGIFTCTGSN